MGAYLKGSSECNLNYHNLAGPTEYIATQFVLKFVYDQQYNSQRKLIYYKPLLPCVKIS